ncbi:hypothetical protein HJFPF1_05034 [Paramyrothecium foliicola]|nr:hypothetical protein HJFPF1_05034 [Paramyrothecium foliicola]
MTRSGFDGTFCGVDNDCSPPSYTAGEIIWDVNWNRFRTTGGTYVSKEHAKRLGVTKASALANREAILVRKELHDKEVDLAKRR